MEKGCKSERSREGASGVRSLGVDADAAVLQTSCALSLSLISSCVRRADHALPGIFSSARQCRCSQPPSVPRLCWSPAPPRASSPIMRISAAEILSPTHTASFIKFTHSFHPYDSHIRKRGPERVSDLPKDTKLVRNGTTMRS